MNKPIKLFTLDTETRGLFGEVFRVGLFTGEKFYATNTTKEIMEILDQYAEQYECHVYIHNLDFDIAKMAKEFVPIVDFEESIFINNNVAVFGTKKGIYLHDSLKLIPASLAKICQAFGLEEEGKMDLKVHLINEGYAVYSKGKYDENKSLDNYFSNVASDEEVLNEYLFFDCKSLHTVVNTLVDISGLTLDEFISCPTTASLAMKVYKEVFPDDYVDATSSKWYGKWGRFAEDFIRLGYYGGRTEVFIPHMNKGFHYDVNSLYPFAMKENNFPIGYYKHYKNDKAKQIYHYCIDSGVGAGLLECDVYVPETLHIPPLPYRHDGKLLFPTGRLSGIWTFHELENAARYGCIIENFKQCFYFEKTYSIFKEYVEYFEDLKNTSEGALKEFAKLMLNTLYGKFGMQRERSTILPESKEHELKANKQYYYKAKHDLLQQDMLITFKEARAQYIQPQLAAYVTSYARIHLYNQIMEQLEKGDVVYCDTDSIVCTASLRKELTDKQEFGKWDLEGFIKEGLFIQPKFYAEKRYMKKDVIKAKGIPKSKLQHLTFETYEDILQKIKDGYERIELFSDYKARQKFVSMLKANEDFDTPVYLRKGLNLLAKQKRNIDYVNNTSTPWTMGDYNEFIEGQLKLSFEDYKTPLLDDDSNVDSLQTLIANYGHIKCLTKKHELYPLYERLSKRQRQLYFRRNGMDLEQWCELAGILQGDLFLIIEE